MSDTIRRTTISLTERNYHRLKSQSPDKGQMSHLINSLLERYWGNEKLERRLEALLGKLEQTTASQSHA